MNKIMIATYAVAAVLACSGAWAQAYNYDGYSVWPACTIDIPCSTVFSDIDRAKAICNRHRESEDEDGTHVVWSPGFENCAKIEDLLKKRQEEILAAARAKDAAQDAADAALIERLTK